LHALVNVGTEPRGLYNVVLFLLHDRGSAGRVTLEEAMKITYLRVGKVHCNPLCTAADTGWLAAAEAVSCSPQEALDEELAAVFGTADLNSGKTLGLTEFLSCLHAHQLQQIRSRPTMKSRQGSGVAAGTAASPGVAPAVAAK
jgi:calmodulin